MANIKGSEILAMAEKYKNKKGAFFSKAYGLSYVPEWCVIYTWYVFKKAGALKYLSGGQKVANVTKVNAWCTKQKYKHVALKDAKAGDIVLFTWSGKGYNKKKGNLSHIGICVKAISSQKIRTIEGNVGNSVNTKSVVAYRTRPLCDVYAVYRPPYAPESHGTKYDHIVKDVLLGKYGVGEERKKKLGSDYEAVQDRINEVLTLTDAVLRGDYGVGEERKKKLGSDYDIVQWNINRIYEEKEKEK